MSVTVQPSYRWGPGTQDVIAGLALTAAPIATVDKESIGRRELILADLQTIAATAVLAPHRTYTTASSLVLAARQDAQIALVTGTGSVIGQFVACNQPALEALIYGSTVTVTGTVELRARNLGPSSLTLASGTVIKYMLLQ